MKQERVQKPKKDARREDPISEPVVLTENAAALADDLEELLAAIDDVLEADAQTFVANYIQKNGE